jgi:integrase
MSEQHKRIRNRNAEWPFIRFSERENAWRVDARTKHGGSRRFFPTKIAAEAFAQQCRIARENEGTSAFGNAELTEFGKTVQDAISFYLEHLRKQSGSIPLREAMVELIETRRAAGRSEVYCYDLKLRLGRFEREFPNRTIASFTAKELESWLIGLGAAPATRNTFRRDLRTLFSFCEKRGYCFSNEAAKTDRAKDVDKPAGILTVSEAQSLLSECRASTLPFVAISLFAGLRAAEAKKLDWSEVDLEGGHIEVRATKAKTARRRLVPISPNLAAWLKPVVQKAGSVTPPGIRKRMEAIRKGAGIHVWPPNAMRHSFGSYRLAQCHDAARVSLEMGNSPAMVFAHYRELVKPRDAESFWSIVPRNDAKTPACCSHQDRAQP